MKDEVWTCMELAGPMNRRKVQRGEDVELPATVPDEHACTMAANMLDITSGSYSVRAVHAIIAAAMELSATY